VVLAAMKRRVWKRRNRRRMQAERWSLVHAAGCTERDCCTKAAYDFGFDYFVSVPRSLRHLLGRYTNAV